MPFFELDGGGVWGSALTASSNLPARGRDYVFRIPNFALCFLDFSSLFLSAASGGNELGSNPLAFCQAGLFGGLDYFFVFVLRDSRGNKFPTLLRFWKCRSADFSCRFAHGFLPFFESGGNGVFSNARNPSLKSTPYKLGSITSGCFLLCFCRFDLATISLSAPRDVRGFQFHKTIKLPVKAIPSNHLPIG